MRAHYLQHVPFEGLGYIEHWLQAGGWQITGTHLYDSATFPALQQFDLLAIMGGPMSVNDEAEHGWLLAEQAFIRMAIEAGKAVLGVCLGAQLIAKALGAQVYANPNKEIGWWPLRGSTHSQPCFEFPASLTAFHWHGETFDLPATAVQLASSRACEHQAFQFGKAVIALQFHLEATPESVQQMVLHGQSELTEADFVQTGHYMLAATPEHYPASNRHMARVLEYLRSALEC